MKQPTQASFELKLHPIINKLIADNLDNLAYSGEVW